MKFQLSNKADVSKAKFQLDKLIAKEANIDMSEKRKPRTLSQNNYLHVCITLYALEFGYSIEEAKTQLKRECSFMRYKKKGHHFLKQTSKLDTKELAQFVEWIKIYSSHNGLYIPSSEEYLTNKFSIDREIEIQRQYL